MCGMSPWWVEDCGQVRIGILTKTAIQLNSAPGSLCMKDDDDSSENNDDSSEDNNDPSGDEDSRIKENIQPL